MRTLKLFLFAIASAIAVLLVAAACGGDADKNGAAEVELPPPGEYSFDVTGSMEIELSEELVSAAPTTAGAQATQTVDLTGKATINFETGEFNIPQFGISGKITVGGEEKDIQVNQNPDTPSTGTMDADSVHLGFSLDIELVIRDDTRAWMFDIDLEGRPPRVVDGVISDFTVMTPGGFSPASLVDAEGNTQGSVSAMDLTFTPGEPGLVMDDADEGPPAAPFPAGFKYLSPFGFSADQAADVTRMEDGPGGHIYADPTFPPGFTGDVADLLGVDHALINVSPEAAQILGALYPCGQGSDALETVCTDPAAPFPSGDVYFFSSQAAAPPPLADDPLFTDRECIWATTISVEGGDNFVAGESFPDDFYGGTFYWNELSAGLSGGYINQLSTPGFVPVPGANVRTIIDRGSDWTTTFIPADQVPGATGFRGSVDCHLADFDPAGSGGDPLGGRPSVGGLFPLATNEIPIDGTFPGLVSGPGDVPPAQAKLGDVNCDGKVDRTDATLILQLDAGLIDSLPCPDAGDVNGDGKVDSVDAALILQFDAGLIPSLSPPDGDELVPVEPPETIIE